jgi:hypothetical protein
MGVSSEHSNSTDVKVGGQGLLIFINLVPVILLNDSIARPGERAFQGKNPTAAKRRRKGVF